MAMKFEWVFALDFYAFPEIQYWNGKMKCFKLHILEVSMNIVCLSCSGVIGANKNLDVRAEKKL